MTSSLVELERQFQGFPSAVGNEFRRAAEKVRPGLGETDLLDWALQGMGIAKQTVRSWEAASEYFRVSPEVLQQLYPAQFLDWGRCGSALCQESPSLAVAFFQSSPSSVPYLRPRLIQSWADLGRKLYKGTWKTSAIAAKLFEVSGSLLEHMGYHQLEQFVDLVNILSHKSADLAVECLLLGQEVLPKIGDDRSAFIRLSQAVAETNWREVKGCFDSMQRVLTHMAETQRARFLGLAALMVQAGTLNISLFLNESAVSLGKVDETNQGHLLNMAETLLPISHEAVAAFLRTSPGILEWLGQQQLTTWFETGINILQENHEGGLAYFKVESNTSEQVLESLSSAVELDRVKEILRMYCRALAGASVDIAPTKDLLGKKIGWVSEEHAATEGTTIFLPPVVQRYNSKSDNFSMFKVLSTHQVAHIEFGSFRFSFETPSARFTESRLAREQELLQSAAATIGLNGPSIDAKTATTEEAAKQLPMLDEDTPTVETGFVTDVGRFFNLFDNRRLALDIFTVVEDGRLDHRVQVEYPGVAQAYQQVQRSALEERPAMEQMPLQQAMVEFLVRLSLQQNRGLPCPVAFVEAARAIAQVARRLLYAEANVEDSAEATIRIYDLIAGLPNVEIPEEEWAEMDFDEEEISEEELEQLLEQLRSEPVSQELPLEEQQSYESPPQVDYRGDFKPELSQLMATLRQQQEGRSGEQQQGMEISKEMLQQLLANSAELELELDAESGQYNLDLQLYIENMLKEAGSKPLPVRGHGYAPNPHEEETGGALETKEPLSFVYDEWDFRAIDYKPRWCIVREKLMSEGDPQFFADTLRSNSRLMARIRSQFEMIMPEMFRKIRHLPDGDDFDLDAVVESIIDKWAGESPSEKVHWRRNKIERDVAVVFLMDMSASTAEAIDESRRIADDWDAPEDPVEYMVWLRHRRSEAQRRSYKRIIDLEKESIVLLINAMETIGDTYGIYGFSGYGRENVEFYVIKDIEETFSDRIKRRIDKITPLHATRMGPAIRHATSKLERQEARTKLLFLISDGRPQDRGYSREGVEKEYAVHDTKMALIEARRKSITPFCLTVDKAGHDYLKTMCQDMGYEVLADINSLPARLPMLYRKLTI